MEVTSVRKVRARYLVTVGGETLRLPARLYEERPLREGDEIDLGEYDQWLLLRQYPQALNHAVTLLGQRPFAEKELEDRLLRLGYRPATCAYVLFKLNQHHLLDDSDFARQWAAARAGRRLGPGRIARELRRKGVSQEDAEAALSEVDEEEYRESAAALARKGYASAKAGEDSRRTAQRVTAMLVRRGFSFDQARQAIRQIQEETGEAT